MITPGGAADLAHLLDGHDIGQNVRAGAAVLLGEIDAHHPQLRHLLDGFLGERLVLVTHSARGLTHFRAKSRYILRSISCSLERCRSICCLPPKIYISERAGGSQGLPPVVARIGNCVCPVYFLE